MWIARVRDCFQDVDAESHSMISIFCKEFLTKFERAGKVQNTKAKIAAETVDSKKTTSEFAARETNGSGGTSNCDATC